MSKLLAALLLSLSGLTVTIAHFEPSLFGAGIHAMEPSQGGGQHFAAPEIDPSSAISALTLLLGGLTVVRGRFAKR